jgi:glycosyltransferase involved in cell wall biosynthesis
MAITVCHLMNGFGDASIGRIVQRLITHLDRDRFHWIITGINSQGEMVQEFKQTGVDVIDFSSYGNKHTRIDAKIGSFLLNNKVDIIHTHTIKTSLLAAKALGWHHEVIHLATKHILTTPKERRHGWFYTLADLLSLYLPDHLVAVSHRMGQQIKALPGIKPERVSIIRNAIDCEKYYCPEIREKMRNEFGLDPSYIVYGFAGRIVQAKHLDVLIKAFAEAYVKYPNIRLLIAGEGNQQTELDKLVCQLGISKAVTWAGFRKDIPQFLAGIDIYVQPSINEGLSLSLLEAMAAEKPIIATRVGGTEEVISDGVTGLLISAGSDVSLMNAMTKMIDQPEMRSQYAKAARRSVTQAYDIFPMMNSYQQLYNRLCGYS